ncbi:PIN-like domain-containing protein [Flagellimonas sp.]|uniref:PIN-like domain-containing protein n=1 Tax=Flagellimonas sp. TaxID=2058762 RepID=UPI003BAAF295
MSEGNKNHFIYRKHFPDTKSILARQGKPLKELAKNALFVLDANSLLVPYSIGKENTEEIKKTYESLISQKRLFIPNHALREFARNRSTRIGNLFTDIDNQLSQIPSIKPFEYPILSELEHYQKLKKSRDSISKKIKEYKEYLSELIIAITEWNWSDPVTSMYQSIFDEDMILHPTISEEKLIEEYQTRIEDEIPPGNKDKSKENNAIGDFVIWKCILELGQKLNKDVIFISNDEKNDWMLKGNKKPISPRFELVDEFYRLTKGRDFAIINFKKFLDIQGLDIEFVDMIFNPQDGSLQEFEELIGHENYTLKNLEKIAFYIKRYLLYHENDPAAYVYIEGENLNEHINGFLKSYKQDYFNTKEWIRYGDYFFLFDRLLTEIRSLNDEIYYQEIRMKRDTRTEIIKLEALSIEFINKYDEFSLLI